MAESDQAVRDIVQQLVSNGQAPQEPQTGMGSLMVAAAPVRSSFGMIPAADQMIERARGQLASQPERLRPQEAAPSSFAGAFGMGSPAEEASRPPNMVDRVVSSALGSLATLPRRAIENAQYSLDSGTYDPGPTLEAAMLPMGTGAVAGVPVRGGEAVLGAGPIRAYHGSPHDFDRFDLSKIGTGEGAQAYGRGLYFAENEGVAKQYEKALSAAKDLPSDVLEKYYEPGQIVKGYSGLDLVKKYDPNSRAATVRSVDRQGNPTQDLLGLRDRVHTTQPSLVELNQAFKERGLPEYKPGHMYEVNINADPAHFLDWDKPLVGQPAADVMRDVTPRPGFWSRQMGDVKTIRSEMATDPNSTGARAYGALSRMVGQDKATAALNEAGIPGIKYLDQGSRAAGSGSRNYVVFNEKLIDIARKYGMGSIATLPPAVLAGMAQGDQQN